MDDQSQGGYRVQGTAYDQSQMGTKGAAGTVAPRGVPQPVDSAEAEAAAEAAAAEAEAAEAAARAGIDARQAQIAKRLLEIKEQLKREDETWS